MKAKSAIDVIIELLRITRDDAIRVRMQMKEDAFNFEYHNANSAAFEKAANKALDKINQR